MPISVAGSLALASCGDGEKQKPVDTSTRTASSQDDIGGLFSSVIGKEHAVDIAATRSLKPGERVIVRGRLLGAERLFEENQAMFLMADPAYVTPDESNLHPFRASEVPAAVKRAHMLTVQVLDREGRVLPVSLQNVHGLKSMSYVVVSGVMSAETTPSSPVVDAETIELIEAWPLEAPDHVEREIFNPWGGDQTPCSTCGEDGCVPATDSKR